MQSENAPGLKQGVQSNLLFGPTETRGALLLCDGVNAFIIVRLLADRPKCLCRDGGRVTQHKAYSAHSQRV